MTSAANSAGSSGKQRKVAYIVSRFPKLTETFVLDEILEMQNAGVDVELFPLRREPATLMHDTARPLVARARFPKLLSMPMLTANLFWLARKPATYLGTLATVLWTNRRSRRYLLKGILAFVIASRFARQVSALGITHVHAHFASHPAVAAFVIGRLAGLPWSFTAHGSDLHREQSMLAEKVREARFAVTISDFNRQFMSRFVDPVDVDNIHVVRCGLLFDRFPHRCRHPFASPGPVDLVCVGTLHAVKGQQVLLEACATLTRRGWDLRCHLIGDGPDREALQQSAQQLELGERVVFHGYQTAPQVRKLLRTMDIAVAPSVPTADGRREGLPVALMEAAASGLPLVASRLSGIPELVEDRVTGQLFEPGDAKGLTAALELLLRDPQYAVELGKQARSRVEARHDLRQSVQRLIHLMALEPVSA